MTIQSALYCLIILTTFAVIAICAWYEKKAKIVPAPTLPWVRSRMIAGLVKYLDTDKPMTIAELGSGWGGVVFAVAKKFRHSTVHGYEISPLPFQYAKIRQVLSGVKNSIFYRHSFFDEDLGRYDAIVCYLAPYHMRLLQPKFEAELKPGTIIVANAFGIPGWTPIDTLRSKGPLKIPVYVYRKA